VRRDLNNIVFPIDLSSPQDVDLVTTTIQVFVKRKIPVKFGVVPTSYSPGSTAQLKVAHYLQETYGLASLMAYLEEVRSFAAKSASVPNVSRVREKASWRLRIKPPSWPPRKAGQLEQRNKPFR
jgi:hypothetical protein